MYPDVSYVYTKYILDSFGIRVKYMQNVKIHVFSWNVTEHVRYVWELGYIKIIRIRVSCKIHAGSTIVQDTYPLIKQPPPNSITTPPGPPTQAPKGLGAP